MSAILHSPRHAVVIVLAMAVAATAVPCARGQEAPGDDDLRGENERLIAEVRDLRRELEEARAQIARLEQQLEDLRRQLASARGAAGDAASPQETPVSIDESRPDASPRALIRTLQRSYRDDLGELQVGTPGDRERIAYLRALRRWVTRVNRQRRSSIQWHVRFVEPPQRTGGGVRVLATAVDPQTGATLGEPFPLEASRSVWVRFEQRQQRAGAETWLVRGVLHPNVTLNEQRPERGPFDHPVFIGPFAECSLAVEAASVTEMQEEQDKRDEEPEKRKGS